ncbi:MAG: 3-deoxy-manno-octulosonate cytidylyltransferase [Pseudomonadota bacterium]
MTPLILILIPARYGSTRFPGKPLALISGKSMIQRVYENCATAKDPRYQFEVRAVTDDDRIQHHVEGFGGKVCRVDDQVTTGTERIYLAYQRYFSDQNVQLVINLQGDEPLLSGKDLVNLAEFHLGSQFDIGTLGRKMGAGEEFYDNNRVKIIYTQASGECHYFSRAPIPHARDSALSEWFLHIGVYSFRPAALEKMSKAPVSYYENLEKLEQLRALEMGLRIGATLTKAQLISVDRPEDIVLVERSLRG